MSINSNKDLSHCVARTRFVCLDGRQFWRVYLWKDNESLINNVGVTGDVRACHISMLYWENSTTGEKRTTPLMGELHFVSNDWNIEVVSHECCHAMFLYNESHNLKYEGPEKTVEEQLCYLQGDLCLRVYRWLVKVDKHYKWRK